MLDILLNFEYYWFWNLEAIENFLCSLFFWNVIEPKFFTESVILLKMEFYWVGYFIGSGNLLYVNINWVWTFVYFSIVFALKWYCVCNFTDLEILFHILLSEMLLCLKFYSIWNSIGYFIVCLEFFSRCFFSWIWNFIHLKIYLIWKSIETGIFLNWKI